MEFESKPADSSSEALVANATKAELSHVEALLRVKDLTAQLLSDPFLQDLPPDISLDEVKSKLALEQGSAITLNLRKFSDEVIRKLHLEFVHVIIDTVVNMKLLNSLVSFSSHTLCRKSKLKGLVTDKMSLRNPRIYF